MKINLTAQMAYNHEGVELGKVPDGGVIISNLPSAGMQSIAESTLKSLPKGTVTKTATHITIHTKEGDVAFRIDQPPGRFCLTCGERLAEFEGNGTEAEAGAAQSCIAHVAEHGKKAKKNDKHPHGYYSHPFSYRCTIEQSELTNRLMGAGA